MLIFYPVPIKIFNPIKILISVVLLCLFVTTPKSHNPLPLDSFLIVLKQGDKDCTEDWLDHMLLL